MRPTRRGLARTAAGLAASAGAGLWIPGLAKALDEGERTAASASDDVSRIEPFWGAHQGGIATSLQSHTYAAALDLVTTKRDDVVAMLRAWTSAAAKMSIGQPAQVDQNTGSPPDSGEALGLPAARLTLTFGFGAGLFAQDGEDRYGLAAQRPQALVDLPSFHGDELAETRTGGDLSVQACADDPQVAFHAVRQLLRFAHGIAKVRWAQTGFIPTVGPNQTPRNLMGFKDGTSNPPTNDPAALETFVWVGGEARSGRAAAAMSSCAGSE